MEKFLVLREHLGDKSYAKGDERHARRADVQHLIANGVLGDFPQEIVEDPSITVGGNTAAGPGGGAAPAALSDPSEPVGPAESVEADNLDETATDPKVAKKAPGTK